jgi:hypothetical protein
MDHGFSACSPDHSGSESDLSEEGICTSSGSDDTASSTTTDTSRSEDLEVCEPPVWEGTTWADLPDWAVKAELLLQQSPAVSKLMFRYWEVLHNSLMTDEQAARQCLASAGSLRAAIASVAHGKLLDVSNVVAAITDILGSAQLHLAVKEALVKSLLECETLSFAHLFCSDGGSMTVQAIYQCSLANGGSLLLKNAVLELQFWARKVCFL